MPHGNVKKPPSDYPANALPSFGRAELPRLDLLRSFEAAARTLSFTQAAEELFLTQ
ncbi:MAG TPA: LysR family transcriptional regulator, partial [Casimicrobium huifangae]|nr:LysR family transcriptional regulator [Casimicrobium huifangae]